MPQPVPATRYIPPSFANPYPDRAWSQIGAFSCDTGLHLLRSIESVQMRAGEKAAYIVA